MARRKNEAISSKELVNLDALIPRSDLDSTKPAARGSGGISVFELALGKHYYGLLRKPHFQRETDDWSIDNVVTLIKSFRDGHLIPAVILWTGEGVIFVIDGAHRLSALIAWVNDDYGDREISGAFFKNDISKRQRNVADECRRRVAAEVGTYSALNSLTRLPNRTQEQLAWSTNIAQAVETQWVIGDAGVAATSFLVINQRAVVINPTERYMIEQRKKPNVIAARAIVKGARGHAYWGGFEEKNILNVEKKGRSIFDAIFEPEGAKAGKDTELQPAGYAYTANGLRIALDLVNLINDVKGKTALLNDDANGDSTARYIEKTNGVVKYISGDESASLSLHPAVYFWGDTGNHRPAVFLAMVCVVQEMIKNEELVKFTLVRARLEEFLLGKGEIGKHILGKHGGWKKSVAPVKTMLKTIVDGLAEGKSETEIETLLRVTPPIGCRWRI